MKAYEKRTCEYEHEVSHTCDFCGADIGERMYDKHEVRITAVEGKVYPEGGHVDIFEAEACLPCFRNKIEPALRALGLLPGVTWRNEYC